MKEKTILIFVVIVGLAVMISSACQGNVEQSKNTGGSAANSSGNMMNGPIMNDPEMIRTMMQQMMKDPAMMRQMMDQMMNNQEMMRQMMADPKMSETMIRHMNENADAMGRHMQTMMGDGEHRRAMVEMLRGNKEMREQMRSIIEEADKPATK